MDNLSYLTGFNNEHETEALPGALPKGQFSPQKVNYKLYAEQFSSTAFTAPRAENRRSWTYRLRPSIAMGDFEKIDNGLVKTALACTSKSLFLPIMAAAARSRSSFALPIVA